MSKRYIFIVLFILVLMTLYVWQNIEIVKTKMDYRKLYRQEKELIQQNDILRYNIESMRTLEKIRKQAPASTVQVSPSTMKVIVFPENKKNEAKN